jgi:hypothetical protein
MILIVLVLAAPGVAVTFDLSNPSGVLGTQQDYSAGLATLTAYGYKLDTGSAIFGPTIGAAENLFGNTGGANESGLGLANISLSWILATFTARGSGTSPSRSAAFNQATSSASIASMHRAFPGRTKRLWVTDSHLIL